MNPKVRSTTEDRFGHHGKPNVNKPESTPVQCRASVSKSDSPLTKINNQPDSFAHLLRTDPPPLPVHFSNYFKNPTNSIKVLSSENAPNANSQSRFTGKVSVIVILVE